MGVIQGMRGECRNIALGEAGGAVIQARGLREGTSGRDFYQSQLGMIQQRIPLSLPSGQVMPNTVRRSGFAAIRPWTAELRSALFSEEQTLLRLMAG